MNSMRIPAANSALRAQTCLGGACLRKQSYSNRKRTGRRVYAVNEQHSFTDTKTPAVPEQYAGTSQEAYLAGFKSGYAAGVQVTVSVTFGSEKGLNAVQYSSGVQQDSLFRSVLKGLVWRVFSTALTVSIILVVFHDTVQIEQALKIGGLEFVLKFLVYFAHERLWVQIGDNIE